MGLVFEQMLQRLAFSISVRFKWAWVISLFLLCFYMEFQCADDATSGVGEVREAWESRRKAYTSEFLEFDPCIVSYLNPYVP